MRNKDQLLWGLILLAGVGAAVMAPKIASAIRGIRNHNPGNIERTSTVWQGMAADQSGDPRFIVFIAPEWGIRAMARILRNYVATGYNTIRAMIGRWAPASENDTAAYVASVSRATGIAPDQAITSATLPSVLPSLLAAIIRHENGIQPYAPDVIARGIALERNA